MTPQNPKRIIVFVVIVVVAGLGYALLRDTDVPAFLRVAILFSIVIAYKVIFVKKHLIEEKPKNLENEKHLQKRTSNTDNDTFKATKRKIDNQRFSLISNDVGYDYTIAGLLTLMALCMTYAIFEMF